MNITFVTSLLTEADGKNMHKCKHNITNRFLSEGRPTPKSRHLPMFKHKIGLAMYNKHYSMLNLLAICSGANTDNFLCLIIDYPQNG